MLDAFSQRRTFIQGANLPDERSQIAIIADHEQRLEAIDSVRAAAAECGITTDSDRDLLVFPEDEVSILENEGGSWGLLWRSLKSLREQLPLLRLDDFGFPGDAEGPLDEFNAKLTRIGTGMEAWAFTDEAGSVYKFFMPRVPRGIGATFKFSVSDDGVVYAQADLEGSYADLFKKILLLNIIGGMPTETVGITPEGIFVFKQTTGQLLEQGTDTSLLLSSKLAPCPSRFLRCNRAQPRVVFYHQEPWLIADLHERNLVYDQNGQPRIIDLVAAQFPLDLLWNFPALRAWLEKVRLNPAASVLDEAPDEDL